MRSIYAGASQVLIWLGESDPDTDKAMDVLHHLSTSWDRAPAFHEIRVQIEPVLPGIGKLLQKPWWSRIWVVQETAVSTNVPRILCGRKWAAYDMLLGIQFSMYFVQHGNPLYACVPKVSEMRFFFEEVVSRAWEHQPPRAKTAPAQERTFAEILMGTSMHDATEPRDKVFAVVGLQPTKSNESLLPDYDLSVSEVFQRAMMEMLSVSAHWLESAAKQDSKLDLPSWCIDFSGKGWYSSPSSREVGGCAGVTGELPNVIRNAKTRAISIPGLRIGVVEFVGPRDDPKAYGEEPTDMVAFLISDTQQSVPELEEREVDEFFEEMALFTEKSFAALKKRLGDVEASKRIAAGDVWQVIGNGHNLEWFMTQCGQAMSVPRINDYSLLERWMISHRPDWASLSQDGGRHDPEPLSTSFETRIASFMRRVPSHVINCAFFTTDTGYFGRADGNGVCEGDVVAILFDCGRPAILRQVNEDAFRLVAFTWVQGVMNKELIQDLDSRTVQKFRLV